MAADGSIIIETNIDNKKAQKELSRLNRQISSLEEQLAEKTRGRLPLEQHLDSVNAKLEAARKQLSMLEDEQRAIDAAMQPGASAEDYIRAYSDREMVRNALAQQRKEVSSIEREWAAANKKLEDYDIKMSSINTKLNQAKESAGEIQQNIARSGPSADRMSKAMGKMQKSANRFSLRLREVIRSALIFTVISQSLASLREWFSKVVKSNDEATSAIARLKAALLTLAQPLVNVIIPAFTSLVNILAQIVTEIARVVSILFGTTIEESAEAAEGLYDETDAIESVGDAAKEARKDLASFDRINKLGGSATTSGGNDTTTIQPDFSFLKDGILSNLTFTLEDILFKWKDLTVEDILSKLITLLTAIAGGVIGFTLGGVGGAVIGILVGAGLGLLISNLTFNGDGKLDEEEILKGIILSLGILTGGILGFVIGGPGGAALGILLGAGIALGINSLIFNGDGKLDTEEILQAIITVLGAIAGGVVGFIVGGPAGAAIGVLVGAGFFLNIASMIFNGDGVISKDEIVKGVIAALGALVGGIIGFVVGGPAGALIGVAIGAFAGITISDIILEGTGADQSNQILDMIIKILALAVGGILGFVVGGPAGAVIGVLISAGILLAIDSVSFSDETNGSNAGYEEGKQVGENVEEGARDSLGTHSPSTEFENIGNDVVAGLSNGISESGPMAREQFSSLLSDMETDSKSTSEKIKENFKNFLDWFSTEFFEGWNTTWNECYNTVYQNVQSIISNINSLNASLASIERNITITITTVYKTVGSPSGGVFSSSSTSRSVSTSPFGLSLQDVPALARGAVIPPNREFLAVLGDQTSGTNVEAPLSTIEQAVANVMNRMGYGGDQTVILQVDKDQLGKVVYKLNKAETRRIGVNLAGV